MPQLPQQKKKIAPGWRIAVPLAITFLVVAILFSEDFHPEAFSDFHFTWRTFWGIALAVLAFLVQNATMAMRYKMLSGGELSFMGGLRVQQMMEFTSAATPSSVGGSGVLFLFLSTENIKAGKATAITFSALFLDELLLFLLSLAVLVASANTHFFGDLPILSSGLEIAFYGVTIMIGLWTVLLFVALFVRPDVPSIFVKWLSRRRRLRKYSAKISRIADELYSASKEITNRSFAYWLKLFLLTVATWGFRFAIATALIYGFARPEALATAPASSLLFSYAEQIVIWMLSIIMPTPGGSGFAEYMFKNLYGSFFFSSQIALVVAVIWRCLNAYIYFLSGGLLLSFRWQRIGLHDKESHEATDPPQESPKNTAIFE